MKQFAMFVHVYIHVLCRYLFFYYLNFRISDETFPPQKMTPALLTSGYFSLNFGAVAAAKEAPPGSSTTDFNLSKMILQAATI